jgi:hypothetical protein
MSVSDDLLIVSVGINIVSSPNVDIPSISILEAVREMVTDVCGVSGGVSDDVSDGSLLKNGSPIPDIQDDQSISDAMSSGASLTAMSLISKFFVTPEEILAILLANVEKWFFYLDTIGFPYIRSYWLRNINKIKCRTSVANGRDRVSGVFIDIDEVGRAVLEQDDGRRLFICSGDLFDNQEGIVAHHD